VSTQEDIVADLIRAARKMLVIKTPGQLSWIEDGLARGSNYWEAQVMIYKALEEWDAIAKDDGK
jgi:hypothetical protein